MLLKFRGILIQRTMDGVLGKIKSGPMQIANPRKSLSEGRAGAVRNSIGVFVGMIRGLIRAT